MGLREVVMTSFRRSPLSERNSLFQTVVFTCQRTLQAATGGLWRVSAGLPGILGLWRPAAQVSSIVFYWGLKRKRIFVFKPQRLENHQGKDSRCSATFSIVSRDFFFEGIFPSCQGAHDAVFIACEHFVFDFMEVIVETLPEQPLPLG